MNNLGSVPNPMADIPPSPVMDDGHGQHEQQQAVDDGLHSRQHSLCLSPLPPSIPSPLDFDDSSEPVNSNPESKRMRSDGIRWQQQPSLEPINFSPHQQQYPYHPVTTTAMPSKPSSSSLASSHPSHASFTSADSSVPASLTPDNLPLGQLHPRGVALAVASHNADSFGSSPTATGRRLKRLERNRESARLSRKRRKAYLEELEHKVHSMSGTVDQQRVSCVLGFLREVKARFAAGIHNNNNNNMPPIGSSGIKHNLHPLPQAPHNYMTKSRIPNTLQIIYAFQHQYLSSLVVSKEYKFLLWLMLQKEGFWRGGRGSSERLSAARIGERVSLLCLLLLDYKYVLTTYIIQSPPLLIIISLSSLYL
jgi:hypothetical protein